MDGIPGAFIYRNVLFSGCFRCSGNQRLHFLPTAVDGDSLVTNHSNNISTVFANEKDVDIMVIKNMVENQLSTSMELAYGKNTIKKLDIVNMELPIDAAGVPHYFILDKDICIVLDMMADNLSILQKSTP